MQLTCMAIEKIHMNGYQCVVKEIHINSQIPLAIGRGWNVVEVDVNLWMG